MMETVGDLMTPNPITVREDANIVKCATLMATHRMRHLPVVDGDGVLAGIVADHQVFSRGGLIGANRELWVSYDEGDEALTAGEIAAAPVVVAHPDDDLVKRLRHLLSTKQDGAVVVDDERHVVGVLTEHDGVQLAQTVLSASLISDYEDRSPVITVRHDDSGKKALELMDAEQIRHIVVEKEGRLFGVISWRDLIEDDVANHPELTAARILRRLEPFSVTPDTPLLEAAELMAKHEIGCLPVVNALGQPQGVLTRTDIIEAALSALDDEELFNE